MHSDTLTRMEHSGSVVTVGNPTPAERDALALHYGALKAQKHAIMADETHNADGSTELRFVHYRTCLRCLGAR